MVGLALDDAVTKLESLGFGVTWVDGKSPKEVGQIYQQEPGGGKYYVPYRTTVVVYRTIEHISEIESVSQSTNLTPEELANSGNHTYILSDIKCEVIKTYAIQTRNECMENSGYENTKTVQFIFSNSSVSRKDEYYDFSFPRTNINTYSSNGADHIITFYLDGFTDDYLYNYTYTTYDSTDSSTVRWQKKYVLKE